MSRTQSKSASSRLEDQRSKRSGAHAAPRISIFRPFTLNSRYPLSVNSEVTSRTPNVTVAASEVALEISKESFAVYKFCSPIVYGHQSFAFGKRSSVYCSGRKLKLFASPAFSETGWLTCFPSTSTRRDRKSTRLNSSHSQISYAVFCLKKKNYH